MRHAELILHEQEFSFSAGHFTIFSATEREHLHGHNYYVRAKFYFRLADNGLSFDYRHYKKKLHALCEQLNTRFLLPSLSPFLRLEETRDYLIAHFNNQPIPFLKSDVLVIPISNITIEELSYWFLKNLIADAPEYAEHGIADITIHVYNGPNQSAGASLAQLINT